MGTPRAKKSTSAKPLRSARAVARTRPHRPDPLLHAVDDKESIALPVKPDTRAPVRPISVRSRVTIGEKTV
jgi:hypothetical protein